MKAQHFSVYDPVTASNHPCTTVNKLVDCSSGFKIVKSANAFTGRSPNSHSHKASGLGFTRNRISTKEARKLLGKDFSSLPDEEIDQIVNLLDFVTRDFVGFTVPKSDN